MIQPSSPHSAVDPDLLREIERLFQQILRVDDAAIGPATSFFALGGTSLQAVALAACLQRQFDVELTAASILDHPTPAVLTRHVAALQAQVAERVEEEGLL
jgi:nonribosomal peptide synthetase protein BlmIV